ncbi:DNA polymerase III [Paenibacillus sp. 481]|uniref:DNA polymerase III n=1 Tax=Paenibacillus sp. 481 TaxID=2835869 RepID=UPI001E3DEF51|nr:DNA polymerase III [Paenibacillus sp. 481]UHA72537.1 DNA polymerase III [Paenibacillus sp. 481]
MSIFLYHAYLPENHEHHVALEEIMNEGIKHSTKSNERYSNGGAIKPELTKQLKPSGVPVWVNFEAVIGVDLFNRFSKSFFFPVFTDKIQVFNSEVSLSIYDQAFYEDLKDFDEEALNFDTGETIEYWISEYWKSMITLEEYLLKKPFQKPEVLIFETVPPEIIQVCEDNA